MKDMELALARGSQLERCGWLVCFLGMLTQVSALTSFPSYNIVLGFWAAYCSFTRNGRAIFGFICFSVFSLILDIVFCCVYGPADENDHAFKFALVMFILCMFVKMAGIYTSSQLFAAIGGPASMEVGYQLGNYDTVEFQGEPRGYYPPDPNDFNGQKSQDSIASVEGI